MPGDKNRREPGHYEVVKKEAEVVKVMFKLLVNDKVSTRGIVRELTKRGIAPRHGKHWRPSTVHRILRNETYIGTTYYNKYMAVEPQNGNGENGYRRRKNASLKLRPVEQWIPIELPKSLRILGKATFDRAQRQLEINARKSPRNVKHHYLLRGMIVCGLCGSPCQGTACHGTRYYRCGNRHRTFPEPEHCPAGSVRAANLEKAVWDTLCNAIENPDVIAAQIDKLKRRARQGQAALTRRLGRLDRDIATTDQEENRILDAYREKVITMGQLDAQLSKIKEKKRRLSHERQDLIERIGEDTSGAVSKGDVAQYCGLIKKRLTALSGDFEGKRHILDLLVNKIVWEGKTVRIRGVIPAISQGTVPEPCRIAPMSY